MDKVKSTSFYNSNVFSKCRRSNPVAGAVCLCQMLLGTAFVSRNGLIVFSYTYSVQPHSLLTGWKLESVHPTFYRPKPSLPFLRSTIEWTGEQGSVLLQCNVVCLLGWLSAANPSRHAKTSHPPSMFQAQSHLSLILR
jgi:hypothetical protein